MRTGFYVDDPPFGEKWMATLSAQVHQYPWTSNPHGRDKIIFVLSCGCKTKMFDRGDRIENCQSRQDRNSLEHTIQKTMILRGCLTILADMEYDVVSPRSPKPPELWKTAIEGKYNRSCGCKTQEVDGGGQGIQTIKSGKIITSLKIQSARPDSMWMSAHFHRNGHDFVRPAPGTSKPSTLKPSSQTHPGNQFLEPEVKEESN